MAAKKTSASKSSRKAASKKRKAAPKKTAASKKTVSKKTISKKAVSKKAAVNKSAVRKPVVKKAAAKKVIAKKAVLKKSSAKKATTKKKIAPKKLAAKKPIVKTATKTTAVKKTSLKKTAVQKTLAKKVAVKKTDVSKKLPPIRVAPPAARKTIPPKTAIAAIKSQVTPPVPPVRRPASAMLRAKTAASAMPKLAGSVRTQSVSRRAARSPARGLTTGQVATSKRDSKSRTVIDQPLSEQKLREHIRTAVLYLEAWLRSSGVDVTPAMAELAAPAEAARAQVWRWLDREARFEDDRMMTAALLEDTLQHEMQLLRNDMGPEAYDAGLFATAAPLFLDSTLTPNFEDFPDSAAKLLE